MISRTLAWLLIFGVAGAVSLGQPPRPTRHYHCMCYEICKKAKANERCGLDLCNGQDPNYRGE
jgi:hypothetical protein